MEKGDSSHQHHRGVLVAPETWNQQHPRFSVEEASTTVRGRVRVPIQQPRSACGDVPQDAQANHVKLTIPGVAPLAAHTFALMEDLRDFLEWLLQIQGARTT